MLNKAAAERTRGDEPARQITTQHPARRRCHPLSAVSSSRLKVDRSWLECPMLKTSVI
jgi:hypothetical protein